jgi:signal transduction histidine kinase
VLAFGLLSIAILGWAWRIAERRAEDAAMANVVMDLRLRASMAPLAAEQILAGGGTADRARAHSILRDVAHLARVLVAGGEGKDFLVVSPSRDPGLRAQAEEVQRLTTEWLERTRAALRGNGDATAGGADQDRRRAAFGALQRRAADLEQTIETEQVADIARSRHLFQLLLVAWSIIVVSSTTSLWHRERARVRAEDALRAGQERLEALVSDRTSALRSVNMALLTAQEVERRRISTELHDQLGHSLILMKFRLALVARELAAGPSKARDECAELCGHVDRTLEDVRRLARDLRPSVLEELGLSAALRWLADSYGEDSKPVETAIDEIDAWLPRDAQVVVYRIVQQALTNAARHSGADHVSISAKREGNRLWFVVEDDGRGFDAGRLAEAGPAHGGLGLATMHERAAMIGGFLDVWSETGKGTRVTLGVPVPD